MQTQTTARIHEHAGRVAILIGNATSTLYLSPDLADQLGEELQLAAMQIRNGYHYATKGINREI